MKVRSGWWDPWVLRTNCGYCKAPPGQECNMKRGPFHAERIDKGLALQRKERMQRQHELDALL